MKRILLLVAAWAVAPAASAQHALSYYLPDGVTYSTSVPVPSAVIGFDPGDRHLHHHELLQYVRAVDAASNRMVVESIGRTHGGREQVLVIVTHPDNHARLEQIRQRHLEFPEPGPDSPVVVWMGYSVHGNEPSGVNAVPVVLYHLAAAQGAGIDEMLKKMVIIIEPSINPDGMDRFAHWTNTLSGRNPSTSVYSREHNETWPGGRTNYYHYDLNRDWMPVQHPESRNRLRQYHRWRPNLLTDHHEMGTSATFFFQPGIPSRNFPLSPERGFQLTAEIGTYHARQLDGIGSLYYTRESFDDFYIGKGSTYPDVNGSVGILFEQASSRGMVQESVNGDVTFPFTIRNQFNATLSTLAGGFALRTELLNHTRTVEREASREAAAHPVKAYVFGDGHDPARLYHMLDLLDHHEIVVRKLARELTANGVTYKPGQAYVVSLDQPRHRFIRGLFETFTTFTDSLFYDISAWTLPEAFGLDYAALNARTFAPGLLGDVVETPAFPQASVTGGRATYAYAFTWDSYYAPRALNRMLAAGIQVRVSHRAFTVPGPDGPISYPAGSLVVPMGGLNADKAELIHAEMLRAASEDAVAVAALGTGLATEGIDLGSNLFSRVRAPKAMLLTGGGVNPNDAGEIWHTFDVRWNMPVTQVDTENFGRVNLDGFTALVLAPGSYANLGTGGVEKIRRWLQGGGVLVTHGSATQWAVRNELLKVEAVADSQPERPDGMPRYTDAGADRGSQVIGGTIFRTEIDTSHPLFYGYRRGTLATFRDHDYMMKVPDNRYAAPMRYTDAPLVSGYVSKPQLERLGGTAAVVVGSVGAGRVIGLADNPVFRAFWFGTDKILANAVFFGATIDGSTTVR